MGRDGGDRGKISVRRQSGISETEEETEMLPATERQYSGREYCRFMQWEWPDVCGSARKLPDGQKMLFRRHKFAGGHDLV